VIGTLGAPLGRWLERQVRDSVLLAADWPAPPGVRAFTTLRRGLEVGISAAPYDAFNLGAHCGDELAAVAHNRAALRWIGELREEPCWLRQVHGTRCWRFEQPVLEQIEADASVTSVRGLPLTILSADCLPVLLASRNGDEVAAAHAGWRGLAAGVIERTVAAMRTRTADLQVWLGPAIGASAFEVGEEVREAFVGDDIGAASAFLGGRPGHWWCDLAALARLRLSRLGVESVYGGGRCTFSEPESFYSYRRDGICGRMASVIVLA
jgi:YfiH family protein